LADNTNAITVLDKTHIAVYSGDVHAHDNKNTFVDYSFTHDSVPLYMFYCSYFGCYRLK